MARLFLSLFSSLAFVIQLQAQTIHGLVHDKKNRPVAGASVTIKGTFKVAITDSTGRFLLAAAQVKDTFILKVSSLGFDDLQAALPAGLAEQGVVLTMHEKTQRLKDVIISAGSFEASDEKKTTILKGFDLATTPTASPDVFKVVGELPGTSKVGESEGLFVRGGTASETKAVIDGMIVQDPFFSSVPGVAQNGRFSALMFKGTSFSTGGYSAQYGEALSSVLVLNTQDVAQASSTSIIPSTMGLSGNITQKWDNTSLAASGKFYNLKPSFNINPQNYIYSTAPQGGGGNITFRNKGKKGGLFKLYTSYEQNNLALYIPYLAVNQKQTSYSLAGKNIYINSSYKINMGAWQLNAGFSFSNNNDHIVYDTSNIFKQDSRAQGRIVISRPIGSRGKLTAGTETQYVYYSNTNNTATYKLSDWLTSSFAEAEFFIGNKIAARAGVRNEMSGTLHRSNTAPRVSLAYVVNKYSQFSVGYGNFYQLPQETYLYTNKNLLFEEASHYIINYQYTKSNRTLRLEAYYKDYSHLVRDDATTPYQQFSIDRIATPGASNTGYGYAKGLDVFWYDRQSFKNINYWVSYSYLDTKRLFQNYAAEAMPTFAAHHNVSVVVKCTIPKTTVNFGFTYNYTSGRPYYNPLHAFLSDRTPAVNNLIFSGNYSWFHKNNLFAVFIYADNILGIKNIYNYYYSADGLQRYTLTPPAYRSIYAGINITLAKQRNIMGIKF